MTWSQFLIHDTRCTVWSTAVARSTVPPLYSRCTDIIVCSLLYVWFVLEQHYVVTLHCYNVVVVNVIMSCSCVCKIYSSMNCCCDVSILSHHFEQSVVFVVVKTNMFLCFNAYSGHFLPPIRQLLSEKRISY